MTSLNPANLNLPNLHRLERRVRTLSSNDIISIWETAMAFHPVDQAIHILVRTLPELTQDDIAAMSLGQRDRLLILLHQTTFSKTLSGTDACPECGEQVEFDLACDSLLVNSSSVKKTRFQKDGYNIQMRPLNSYDLASTVEAESTDLAIQQLLQRCIIHADFNGTRVEAASLPANVISKISDEALAIDPMAEILISFDCPECHHQWSNVLDIGQIVWTEITALAKRLLLEIHLLASVYRWTESEILSLSPIRRATYLQMVTA